MFQTCKGNIVQVSPMTSTQGCTGVLVVKLGDPAAVKLHEELMKDLNNQFKDSPTSLDQVLPIYDLGEKIGFQRVGIWHVSAVIVELYKIYVKDAGLH